MSKQFTLNLPLAEVALDRDYLTRVRPDLTSELSANSNTLVLVMFEQKVLLTESLSLKFLSTETVGIGRNFVYLGKTLSDGSPVVLVLLDSEEAEQVESDSTRWHHLRRSGAGLSSSDAAIFTQALALANWHENHSFCPSCGSITSSAQAGWVRVCEKESRELYPRTDPAIIVGVVDEHDRILLGSQGAWEDNRYSILAGDVEPGESLDAAVVREMFEEAGIVVADPIYLGSQAWPFPYSLMLGFMAKRIEGDAIPDGEEIVKLRWFSREELLAESGSILLPGKLSIARAIIEHWLGQKLEGQDH